MSQFLKRSMLFSSFKQRQISFGLSAIAIGIWLNVPATSMGQGLHSAPTHVVDLTNMTMGELPTIIAVQVCAGLFNRNTSDAATSVFTLMDSHSDHGQADREWLSAIYNTTDPALTTPDDLLKACMSHSGSSGGRRIRYNYTAQKEVVPILLTVAGVLGAVPLEDDNPAAAEAEIVFDALQAWSGLDIDEVTLSVFEHYGNKTTGMAMLDPGYNGKVGPDPARPNLTGTLEPYLVDYVIKEKKFTFFLYQGCVPGTHEHALLETMIEHANWPRPLAVWGYNNAKYFGVNFFEAETLCTRAHTMGQVASSSLNNLAFYSRTPGLPSPLRHYPPVGASFDPQHSYLTLIVGDGDNLAKLGKDRKSWMEERLALCAANASQCFPSVWTFSPFAGQAASGLARWYFEASYVTGRDYFVLPPSGHLYAYPSIMDPEDRAVYVRATEKDAELYSTDGTVDWEFFTDWRQAFEFYPEYSQRNVIRGLFPVNVPFMLPVTEFGPNEFYRIFNGSTVAFRPREWRGVDEKRWIPLSKQEYLNVTEMAAEVNSYPRGTCSFIYLTSDGGGHLDDFVGLAASLEPHVKIVDASTLVDMALAAAALRHD